MWAGMELATYEPRYSMQSTRIHVGCPLRCMSVPVKSSKQRLRDVLGSVATAAAEPKLAQSRLDLAMRWKYADVTIPQHSATP